MVGETGRVAFSAFDLCVSYEGIFVIRTSTVCLLSKNGHRC